MKNTTLDPVIFRLEIISKLLAIIGAVSGALGIFMFIRYYEVELRALFQSLSKKLTKNRSDETILVIQKL